MGTIPTEHGQDSGQGGSFLWNLDHTVDVQEPKSECLTELLGPGMTAHSLYPFVFVKHLKQSCSFLGSRQNMTDAV